MNYSKEETDKIIQAGKYSLIDFSILTNRRYKPNWHHELIAKELEKISRNEVNYQILMLFLPPRHGKSEEATINFPAWYLGNNNEKEVITASYSADLALDFGGKTRELVNSSIYKKIFNVSLKQDEKNKAKWKTNKGGSYTSVGIGGAITGRGANILIIDDPIKNREEADSEVIREKHWQWFISTAYTRLEPNAKIIIILTRWHLDDLAGRILRNEELAKKTKVIEFPAIAIRDEEYRKQGEALWETRYNLEDLEGIKNSIGLYNWTALYQQTPISTENQEFKKEWFKYRTREELSGLRTRNFMTVDTAYSQRESADYVGICENYMDSENFWNISAYRMKLDPKQLVDFLFTMYANRNFEKIGIEKTAYSVGLKPYLDEEMRRRGKFLPIVELEHKQIHKETRIRGLVPRYSSFSIFHLKGECDNLEEELLTFPKGIHDDVIDAMAYQLKIVKEITEDKQRVNDWRPASEYEGNVIDLGKPLIHIV